MIPVAIASGMIACWMLGVLHPALVGFIGCFLFRAIGGVEFEDAFAGFGTELPWFFYGVLLVSLAADRSGVIGAVRAASPRALRESTVAAAVLLVALAYALAFVVPSSLARATMLMIVAGAWGPSAWLALTAGYGGAAFGHPEMPGGAQAIVGWDLAVMVAIVAAVAIAGSRAAGLPSAAPAPAGHSRAMAIPVVAAVALWLTTPLHGLSPALVGLGCGLVCLLPGIAPRGKHILEVNHLAVVFAGAAITIPLVLEDTKAAELLVHTWTRLTTSAAPVTGYWAAVVYRLFSPDGARPALPSLAAALGSSAIWSSAGSTFLSLHQSPALILANAVGGCGQKQVLTAGVLVVIVGSLVVLLY
jgi:hypothetical protein